VSQLKFNLKAWNNISIGGPGPSGITSWAHPLATPLRLLNFKLNFLALIRCHDHSRLLSSYYLRRIKQENTSCSACRHSPKVLSLLFLTPMHRASSVSHLWHYFFHSIFDLRSMPCGWPVCWVYSNVEFIHVSISRKGSGSTNCSIFDFLYLWFGYVLAMLLL